MAQELGRIERLSAERFTGKRKLFLVLLAHEPPPGAREGLVSLDRYWSQVQSQVASLESSLGPVQQVYHEALAEGGTRGLEQLQKATLGSYPLVRQQCDRGATLQATEDEALLLEVQDLQRCLMLPLFSYAVTTQLREWLSTRSRKRYEQIAERINETLSPGGVGLLIISEHHQVQFPGDMEVFYVRPPALDEYHRWLEEWLDTQQKEATGGDSEQRV